MNSDSIYSLSALKSRWSAAKSNGEMLLLSRSEVIALLSDYEAGAISAETVSEWAEFFDGNEDVEFEPEAEGLLPDILFELASPEINGDLTADRAKSLKMLLSQKSG